MTPVRMPFPPRGMKLLAVLWAAALVGCAPAPEPTATDSVSAGVFGGPEPSPPAWSNVAWVGQRCSGVFVHPEIVVYAAHCGTDHAFVELDRGSERITLPVEFCEAYDGGDVVASDI